VTFLICVFLYLNFIPWPSSLGWLANIPLTFDFGHTCAHYPLVSPVHCSTRQITNGTVSWSLAGLFFSGGKVNKKKLGVGWMLDPSCDAQHWSWDQLYREKNRYQSCPRSDTHEWI
jgi:hypothetical protein